MALFEQTFLKPGRYGSAGTWDADRIRKHLDGTRALLSAGRQPPVLFEHAERGSSDGTPKQFSSERDRRADMVKHGAGWLVDVKQAADGSGVYVLDVTDEIAGKLKDGSIKFTSPEFRPSWRDDASGQEFKNIISHVALTHKPRAIDQGKIEPVGANDGAADPVLRFSLADYEGPIDDNGDSGSTQFADDGKPFGKSKGDGGDDSAGEGGSGNGDSAGDPTANKTPENPDMPKLNSPDKIKQKKEAVLAHLDTIGVGLPADTIECDEEQFLDRLLTSLLTIKSAEAKAQAEQAEKDKANEIDDGSEQIKEQQPPMQFSLADAESGELAKSNKLLSRVIRQEHQSLAGRLESMVKAGKITPACRKQLLATEGATQFSAEGDHLPAYTLPQLVEILDKTTIAGMGITDSAIVQFATEEHPRGAGYVQGDGTEQQFASGDPKATPTNEQAEATARRIHSRNKTLVT